MTSQRSVAGILERLTQAVDGIETRAEEAGAEKAVVS